MRNKIISLFAALSISDKIGDIQQIDGPIDGVIQSLFVDPFN